MEEDPSREGAYFRKLEAALAGGKGSASGSRSAEGLCRQADA